MAKVMRKYDTPRDFADRLVKKLQDSIAGVVRQEADDPLLLHILDDEQKGELFRISLHNAYQSYMNSGNLEVASHYVDNIIRTTQSAHRGGYDEVMLQLDLTHVYPVLRDRAYVERAGGDVIYDDALPGMKMIYIESNEGFSKLVNRGALEFNPGVTEERVKWAAHHNLRSEGWISPKLSLPCPHKPSCTVDVYLDNPVPIECQFLIPRRSQLHMPDHYLISFPDRKTTLVMHTVEAMDTAEKAIRLAKESRFTDVVRRTFLVMGSPNSQNIYWSHRGEFTLLNI